MSFLLTILTPFMLDLTVSPTESEKYAEWWQYLFHTFLMGWGARTISIASLVFGFWLLVRRDNIVGFFLMLINSFLFAYFGGILSLL